MKGNDVIELGQKVRDRVTRFEGIVTAKVEYLNGRVRYCVQPLCEGNEMPDEAYIDEEQLITLTKVPKLILDQQ